MDYLQLCPSCNENSGIYELRRLDSDLSQTGNEGRYVLICPQCGYSIMFYRETEIHRNYEPLDKRPLTEILDIR